MQRARLNRSLRSDLGKVLLGASAAGRAAERYCEAAVSDRPYTATAAAACVGFALGGGLSRGALALLLGTGLGVAETWVGERVQDAAAMYADTVAYEHT